MRARGVRHGVVAAAGTLLALFGLLAGWRGGGTRDVAALANGPLPACRYDDILTAPRGYDDWPETLVDTILRVGSTYAPPDLVSVSEAGLSGSGKVRAVMIPDLTEMAAAAGAAGNAIGVESAYRSYAQQVITFNGWVSRLGYARALQESARPGHSEHQLGLAIDFKSDPGGSPFNGDWGTTPAGIWMKAHAWEYGFILSYPKGKIATVCYAYEPWHYRYVGRDLAAAIHASGLTLRQYLWDHFTTTVVPPPTPKPTHPPVSHAPSPSPTLAATALPTEAPTVPPTASAPPPTPSPSESPAPPIASEGPTPITAEPVANVDGPAVALLGGVLVLGGIGVAMWRRGRIGAGL